MANKYYAEAKALADQLTIQEKASLCSGLDCWNTKPVDRVGIPSVMVSDGPHGLRKQLDTQDNLGIGASVPATCFPTASLTACSFDPELQREMGKGIAEECIAEGVDVILGPGVNMKRSPLCGRNFEYFSEDPYLSGKLAAGYIKGVESQGIGTALKHFAANNQERRRMSIDAVVDERALREYYLKAFEIAVKEGGPRSVMCSYNKLNGCYTSEKKELLTGILRDEWGFDGLVMSDWGATHIRKDGVAAGLDLEMPGSGGINDKKVAAAVEKGELSEEELTLAATRVAAFALAAKDKKGEGTKDHHELAVRVARESMVLLKNEGNLLPTGGKTVAVTGPFAQTPRYQGAGSSKITPQQVDSPYAELEAAGAKVQLVTEDARESFRQADVVIFFGGLPERRESEGFDRADMKLPDEQNRQIEEIAKVNPNVVVVLMGGSPMELPWEQKVKAILLAYLGGEGVGKAAAEILTGKVSPSGRLAETWPYTAGDGLSAKYFPGDRASVQYRESMFCGYRYFDTVHKPVQYVFGHGLSYTSFEYKCVKTDCESYVNQDTIRLQVTVENTGAMEAKETCLVFASQKEMTDYRPAKQLVGFKKESLGPGESRELLIEIPVSELGVYDTTQHAFVARPGEYELWAGGTLDRPALGVTVCVKDGELPADRPRTVYDSIAEGAAVTEIPDEDFEMALCKLAPKPVTAFRRPFTMENCLEDTDSVWMGRRILWIVTKVIRKMSEAEENQDQMMEAAVKEMPFFALAGSSGGLVTEKQLEGIVEIINGHLFKGLGKIIRGKAGDREKE